MQPSTPRTEAAPAYAHRLKAMLAVEMVLAAVFLAVSAEPASAQASPMAAVLCTVIYWIIGGNLGRGIATLAVMAFGIGALVGKVSMGMALTVALGISITFGAFQLAALLGIAAAC